MRSLGANVGAIGANDFLHQAHWRGQASGDHASSQTDPDNAERHTGIYGSVRLGVRILPLAARQAMARLLRDCSVLGWSASPAYIGSGGFLIGVRTRAF
jgi:hypothetical protein